MALVTNIKLTIINQDSKDNAKSVTTSTSVLQTEGSGRIRISFDLVKSVSGKAPNLGIVRLYNLNDETKAKLNRGNTRIILEAGIWGEEKFLFVGTISNIKPIYQSGLDIITEIYIREHPDNFVNTRITKTYLGDQGVKSILEEVVSSSKDVEAISFDYAPVFISASPKVKNSVWDGRITDILDDLSLAYRFNYMYEGDVIYIYDSGNLLDSDNAYIINSNTHLLKPPQASYAGLSFSEPLNPDLALTRTVRIDTDKFDGQYGDYFFRDDIDLTSGLAGEYRVKTITHQGDSGEGSFTTTTECFIAGVL